MIRFRRKTFSAAAFLLFAVSAIAAQSTDQAFPTAVRANEIVGSIKARDIGDARLTSYFYAFNGDQGDIFVNVVTKNFDGDIDIFTADGLRPLTKIVIFADAASNETGRIVYLRRPERLLLRIQGRTPNDDVATYRIKFAGSFVAAKGSDEDDVTAPAIASAGTGAVRVNSVGTIIEEPVKPAPPERKAASTATISDKQAKAKSDQAGDDLSKTVSENKKAASTTTKPAKPATKPPVRPSEEKKKAAETQAPGDPMAAFRLVVVFKDGKQIERPMTDVSRFTVDNGTLTVIFKDGYIGRYAMSGVMRVGIE
ncbi:MAG: hypothetical protein K1X36_15590 [Pyrinomonadaceae bacterium]|nr:hypothetical protein [Pyrinomonadaceae bacterium]